MNLQNQPPIFVPAQYCGEIEKLSKAALMDMVWDLATRAAGADELAHADIIEEVRHTASIVLNYRKAEAQKRGPMQSSARRTKATGGAHG